jgi:hypothetical protein
VCVCVCVCVCVGDLGGQSVCGAAGLGLQLLKSQYSEFIEEIQKVTIQAPIGQTRVMDFNHQGTNGDPLPSRTPPYEAKQLDPALNSG